jgi:hypothetical protein
MARPGNDNSARKGIAERSARSPAPAAQRRKPAYCGRNQSPHRGRGADRLTPSRRALLHRSLVHRGRARARQQFPDPDGSEQVQRHGRRIGNQCDCRQRQRHGQHRNADRYASAPDENASNVAVPAWSGDGSSSESMPGSSPLCTCSVMPESLHIAAAISAAVSVSAGTSERPAPPADGHRIARYGHGSNPSLCVRAVRDAVTFGPSEPELGDPPLPHRVGRDLTGVPAPGHRRPWNGSLPRW